MKRPANVLVVGAGPTGLTLALQAHAHGASVRVVERRTEVFRPSRALIVHPRTLETLRPLGVTAALLVRADTASEGRLRLGPHEVPVRLANLALPDTPFPHLTFMRQAEVEETLARALAERGIAVERGVEAIAICDLHDSAEATLRSEVSIERAHFDFIVGCDGPDSLVRRSAGIEWHGASYREEVILADLELSTDLTPGVVHVASGRRGLLFLFALGERATWRLLATRPTGNAPLAYGQPGSPVPLSELRALLDTAGLPARIREVVWSAPYRLQRRVSDTFNRGRLFLAGDAAHAFSPATGQGMNTGIQDAINLGWKLAFTPTATDPDTLLASYDLERRLVAIQTLALTHLAFWGEASTSPLAALVRGFLGPLAAPFLPTILRNRRLIAWGVRWISQLRVAYPEDTLTDEQGAHVHGWPRVGERLPDRQVIADGQPTRLHRLLAQPGIHVFLERSAPALASLHTLAWVAFHRLGDMPGEGMVATRPDGYVGFTGLANDDSALGRWLAHIGGAASAQRS